MNKLPYGSKVGIARKYGVSKQYVNTVLKEHHGGTLIVRTPTQRKIVAAYRRLAKKYAPRMGK